MTPKIPFPGSITDQRWTLWMVSLYPSALSPSICALGTTSRVDPARAERRNEIATALQRPRPQLFSSHGSYLSDSQLAVF